MGIFLAAHGCGQPPVRIPEQGFLENLSAVQYDIFLAVDFICNGFLHMLERIEVFQLGTRAKRFCSGRPYRHIGITSKAAFLHVAIADIQISKEGSQFSKIGPGFFRRPQIGFADDFYQRNTGSIQIYPAEGLIRIMQKFSRIFFHMNPGDADTFDGAVQIYIDMSTQGNRKFILGNLITFGKIRIKIIFAGKAAFR